MPSILAGWSGGAEPLRLPAQRNQPGNQEGLSAFGGVGSGEGQSPFPGAIAMTPITRRRLANFRANRRGYVSLVIFGFLFFVTLFAEFIANDRPLVAKVDGRWFVPVLADYAESDLIEDGLPTLADWHDRGFQEEFAAKGGWMVWPLVPYSYRTVVRDLGTPAPSPPSAQNWLGTDDQARDVLARVIYGFRVSVLFALTLTVLSSTLGVIAGALQGFYGGWVDLAGQRFLEIWSGLPVLYLLIILSGFVAPSFWWLLGIMALFSWLALVDVVRAEFLRGRNLEYVKAARALGLTNGALMRRHILPNAMTSTLTYLPFIHTGAIATLTALDFLGFGMPPGTASLGELIGQAKRNLQAPWLGLTAFCALALILSLLVFIGEACRDAFDPRS